MKMPKRPRPRAAAVATLAAAFALSAMAAAQEAAPPERALSAVTVFVGKQTRNDIGDAILPIEGFNYVETDFAGLAVSREVFRRGGVAIDLEAGGGAQWGTFRGEENSAAHAWGAAYLRYDRFPWDRYLRTSVGVSTGLNYITDDIAIERRRGGDLDDKARLQHYFAPEIALALPSRPNIELVGRVHHRSGVYGLFCDECGSNIGTLGVRVRGVFGP